MNSAGRLKALYRKYGKDVQFLLVYLREAHAIDGGMPGRNEIEDPVSDVERSKVASTCVAKLKLPMPAVLDRIDDKVSAAYSAWPDRLYLVGKDGKIAFAGGRGPRGFRPDELADAIEDELKGKRRKQGDDEKQDRDDDQQGDGRKRRR